MCLSQELKQFCLAALLISFASHMLCIFSCVKLQNPEDLFFNFSFV